MIALKAITSTCNTQHVLMHQDPNISKEPRTDEPHYCIQNQTTYSVIMREGPGEGPPRGVEGPSVKRGKIQTLKAGERVPPKPAGGI